MLVRVENGLLLGGIAIAMNLPGAPLGAQAGSKLREPLPLDVAASLRGHNGRSPINLSADGEWVAHTIESDENIARDTVGFTYSATGFSFAEGDSRMEATITHTRTGEVLRLGTSTSASWAAVWSPDARRVAFYSDEGGEAGLWIWDRETRRSSRFAGIIVRPYFGFEGVRWSSDSRRLLVKVLPQVATIAAANALDTRAATAPLFPAVEPGQPSVVVRRVDPHAAAPPTADSTNTRRPPIGDIEHARVDLAIVDLETRQVDRLVERTAVRTYAWSPDEAAVAYTVLTGHEANSQQPNYDLVVTRVGDRQTRTLLKNARLGYGIEWSWSPDGRSIAYIASGQLAGGEIVRVSVSDGVETPLNSEGVPGFDPGDGEHAPLWSVDGSHIYAVGDGQVWRIDARSGAGAAVGRIPDWSVRAIVTPFAQPSLWTTDGGRTAWVIARAKDGARDGIFAIDLMSGRSRAAVQEAKAYSGIFNLAASTRTGDIAFVSTDQQHLHDIWLLNTANGGTRQVTRINEALDRYELGQARIIEWHSLDGRPLRGALLLPPGYRPGQRVPLVVYVYGGAMGSTYVNRFGFWGSLPTFNMHVLATRGYAVLHPDAPVREGRTMTDIVATVMPGVNAAIEQGFADPDRLAVMGQSYGSFNTLSLITQTSRFKAAVITAAVLHPDLFAAYLSSIGYYERGQGNMGGSIWEHRDRYFNNSPLFRFDEIETPLLIGQGEKDGDLVPVKAIFNALERLNKPVEYRLYQAEGHVITQKPNVLDFWNRRLDFLAEHLDLQRDGRGGIIFDGDRVRPRRPPTPN